MDNVKRGTSCSRCRGPIEPHRAGSQRYCLGCHAAYMREHRPKHRDLSPEARRRANARSYANVYQGRGRLAPQPCRTCGAPQAEKHHDDYSRPLAVAWLCRPCHLGEHRP